MVLSLSLSLSSAAKEWAVFSIFRRKRAKVRLFFVERWRRRVAFDAAKEMQSPHFRAIIRATSSCWKRYSAVVKSFSHKLNTKGANPLPFRKLYGLTRLEDIMTVIKSKFKLLKEKVNAGLGVYAGNLVGILDKATGGHPEWREPLEDLLVISQKCAEMPTDELWVKREGIVQNLDDRRHKRAMGTLKKEHTKVHTNILFILTRYTRLLQFHKEGAYGKEEACSWPPPV